MSDVNYILSHTDCLSQPQLLAYLNQKLDKPTEHIVESHITDCMFCSDALEGLQLLSAQESEAHIADIKSDIENLLFNSDEKNEIAEITEKSLKETPTLTPKKGGKRITLAAAAGLFLLIFAGGLVVFSYINNNSNFFGNKTELAKGGENKKDLQPEESQKTNRELEETYSLEPNELEMQEVEKATKIAPTENTKALRDEVNKPSTKTREDAVAQAAKNAPVAPPVMPITSSAPLLGKSATEERKEKNEIAKAEVTENEDLLNARRAGSQNTYTQPPYEGKMKDLDKAPAVSKTTQAGKKSSSAATLGKDKKAAYDKEKVLADEASSQSTEYTRLQKLEETTTDNYSLGVYAFNQAKYTKSIKYFKRALRKKDLKNRDEANYYLALAYEKTNDLAKARKIYQELEKSASYKKRAQSRMREMPVK